MGAGFSGVKESLNRERDDMVVNLHSMGLAQLSLHDKLDLLGQLWDDIAATAKPGEVLTDAQREELQRRVALLDEHPEEVYSWEEVEARVRQRLSDLRRPLVG